MKLDSRVRLIQSAIVNLKQQGIDPTMQVQLNDYYGTVIDKDGGDLQVSFEFEDGQYTTIQVWVPESSVRGIYEGKR